MSSCGSFVQEGPQSPVMGARKSMPPGRLGQASGEVEQAWRPSLMAAAVAAEPLDSARCAAEPTNAAGAWRATVCVPARGLGKARWHVQHAWTPLPPFGQPAAAGSLSERVEPQRCRRVRSRRRSKSPVQSTEPRVRICSLEPPLRRSSASVQKTPFLQGRPSSAGSMRLACACLGL